ncbi:MAG: hypothetical protein AAB403_12870 [Planctomycetota bacterium]|mgnify:CR=1 FL=1
MASALHALIAASFGPAAADEWRQFEPKKDDRDKLASAGVEVLKAFPGRTPGACALMSAVFSVVLENKVAQRGYVVAGSLYVGSARVFGEDSTLDGKARFSQSELSWDGHAWLVFGNLLADISIFRTADSGKGQPALAAHVHEVYGRGKGLMICPSDDTGGLRYVPEYVLTQEQVDALYRGARRLIVGN